MIRIRFHARGGHGVKTASRIVGTAAFLEGLAVQDSPLYGAERRGAAVVAFTRVDGKPILERGVINQPDLIIVGDETLFSDAGAAVLAGQEATSAIFVNSADSRHADSLRERFAIIPPLLSLDVSRRTREALGRASALSAGLGAAATRLCGVIGEKALLDAVREELGQMRLEARDIEANLDVARDVFGNLPALEIDDAQDRSVDATAMHPVAYEGAFRGSPSILAPGNAELRDTGTWRVERPQIDYQSCTRCGLCFVFCPDGAIAVDEDGTPVIDYDHCKGCMICMTSCPLGAVSGEKETTAW